MFFSLIIGILCLVGGIWGWRVKSTVTLFGLTTWKANIFLGVINLVLAASYLPIP